jgi:hypothetical protein
MGQESQKAAASEVVRIWKEPKKRLQEMREAKAKKEQRPVSEAELVSKAVDALYSKERTKLGLS